MRLTALLVGTTTLAWSAFAQAAQDSAPLGCAEVLELMRAKAEQNYAGFLLEVKPAPARAAAYASALGGFRARSRAARGDDACYAVLRDYIAWFDDPHLFVYQSGRLDSAETARRARAARTVAMDESTARAYFRRNAARLDPIEGIWYDRGLRVAIVPDPAAAAAAATTAAGASNRFVAVVLASDTALRRPGAVRARFTRRRDGGYDGEMWLRNFARRLVDARLYKRVLLRTSPGVWGKEYPVAARDSGLLDPADPRRPTLLLRGRTVIVSMTSHDPGYKPVLDSLLAAHEAELRGAERLIVDLRGNEGGSSLASSGLMPYIASARMRPERRRFRDAMLMSSEDQMRYARVAFGRDTEPEVQRLLERMRAHVGGLVPLFDSLVPERPPAHDSVVLGPRRVGVLIDRGTVSASEVLVLDAKRSERATVFGEPTAGALDYQSTNIVSLSPRERRWYLGYPTITAGADLPSNGMRGRGIPPDVRLDLARLRDPIAVVDSLLRRDAR